MSAGSTPAPGTPQPIRKGDDEMYAVAMGEMFDAIDFFGPFDSFDEAQEWADKNSGMRSWWAVELLDPAD